MENDVDINLLLNLHFAGRVVRKDLTKMLKEGANVPVYVLEYLLGMYCAVDDDEIIAEGMQTVKQILSENYVRPDEAEKVKSKIKEMGNYKIIDKVTVKLNEKRDVYEATLSNLGVKGIETPSRMVKNFEKLLVGGIWCILNLRYEYEEGSKTSPFILTELKPIQMANLFYNMSSRKVGLVGVWDVVAFDEVAGIKFKDKDGVQIMKDFMASGSFSRGRDVINANAAMVFVGNINQSVDTLVKTGHLFAPFPEEMIDSAFFDRMHAYLPGWEIPKMRPEFLTNQYGLIVDYLAEFLREMRKRSFTDAIDIYFKIGNNLNQRDVIAVRKTVSGLLKLLYPHGEFDKDAVERCLVYALEKRRRVKEQLKKIGGMEFYDVHFSYIDNDTLEEKFVSVPEHGGGSLIPEGPMSPGTMHTVTMGTSDHLGLYRIELQVTAGTGRLSISGSGVNAKSKEAIKIAFDFFKANISRVSALSKVGDHDYHLHIVEIHNTGAANALTLCSFVSFCSGLMNRPLQNQMVVLGDMSLGGNIVPTANLAGTLQVALDSGAKRILIPMSSVGDIQTIPGELFAKFQTGFFADPVDAVFKALGVE